VDQYLLLASSNWVRITETQTQTPNFSLPLDLVPQNVSLTHEITPYNWTTHLNAITVKPIKSAGNKQNIP
jgi:hypothetical protein